MSKYNHLIDSQSDKFDKWPLELILGGDGCGYEWIYVTPSHTMSQYR